MTASSQNILIGAHVSAAGGHALALDRVAALGGNVLQLFSGSPRVWARPQLRQIDTKNFYSKRKENGIKSVFTHALYLINMVSDKPETIRKSTEVLTFELAFDAALKGDGVVVHIGSHQGRGWDAVKDDLVKRIKQVLKETPQNSTLLLENSAGQKGKLCSDLRELRWLLAALGSKRVGWCIDTCHAWAAGYELDPGKKDSIFSLITELKLWDTLRCVHVNDSRDAAGSGRDRHQNLGEGTIPQATLKAFLNEPRIKRLPMILEVPGFDGNGPDAKNCTILKQWLGAA